jgi:hypothetical protein
VILLYGRLDDAPLQRTLEALQDAGAPCVVLAQTALDRERLRIELGPRGVDGVLVVAGQEIPLDRIRSVYARPLELPRRWFAPEGARRATLIHRELFEWLDVSPALVVNRPRSMQANASKPLQAQLIGRAGLEVPESLVTSDPAEVHAFWREHVRIIFKSASGVRSIVQELDQAAAARLPLVAALPVQFQAYVPGVDVRVHVVGQQTYAAEIESPVIDYRYPLRGGAEPELRPSRVPDEMAERCVGLARLMDLPLAGIDLRRRPDGSYVCFEVNPMPAYSYFEAHTGLPISSALAALLLEADTGVRQGEVQHGSGERQSEPDHGDDPLPAAAPHARGVRPRRSGARAQ